MESTSNIMKGNGIDMYDFIPELHDTNDIHLTKRNASIWIGVISSMRPSPPCPRSHTNCFTKCPVYFYKGRSVFSIDSRSEQGKQDFYYIPDEELHFIERH